MLNAPLHVFELDGVKVTSDMEPTDVYIAQLRVHIYRIKHPEIFNFWRRS